MEQRRGIAFAQMPLEEERDFVSVIGSGLRALLLENLAVFPNARGDEIEPGSVTSHALVLDFQNFAERVEAAELPRVVTEERPLLFDQFVERPAFRDASVLQHENLIRFLHGGKPV